MKEDEILKIPGRSEWSADDEQEDDVAVGQSAGEASTLVETNIIISVLGQTASSKQGLRSKQDQKGSLVRIELRGAQQ